MAGLTGNALAPGTETPSPRLFSPGGFSARGTREKRSAPPKAALKTAARLIGRARSHCQLRFQKTSKILHHGCPAAANLPTSLVTCPGHARARKVRRINIVANMEKARGPRKRPKIKTARRQQNLAKALIYAAETSQHPTPQEPDRLHRSRGPPRGRSRPPLPRRDPS
jgi:hypothetical protein